MGQVPKSTSQHVAIAKGVLRLAVWIVRTKIKLENAVLIYIISGLPRQQALARLKNKSGGVLVF